MNKVNLAEKLSLIKDHWNPRIVGELNGQYLKLVKFKGPFTWHHHENEDEMFLVVKGRFRMEFREGGSETSEHHEQHDVWLEEGELESARAGKHLGRSMGHRFSAPFARSNL